MRLKWIQIINIVESHHDNGSMLHTQFEVSGDVTYLLRTTAHRMFESGTKVKGTTFTFCYLSCQLYNWF